MNAYRSGNPLFKIAAFCVTTNTLLVLTLSLLESSFEVVLNLYRFIACALLVSILPAIVSFLMWFYRVHKNTDAFGVRELSQSHAWSVGQWFIPVYNYIRPYKTAKEIWHASCPDGSFARSATVPISALPPWSALRGPSTLRLWWFFFVLQGFVSRFVDIEEEISFLDHLASALWIGAGIACINFMYRVDKRQSLRFSHLESRSKVQGVVHSKRQTNVYAALALVFAGTMLLSLILNNVIWDYI